MNGLLCSVSNNNYNADRLGRIKVLLVGNQGCGKTSLAHLLAEGHPVAHTRPTVGCNVTLMVMQYPPDRAKQNPALAGQEFFLEIWDVGADPRHEAMRGLFYQNVNGVMLMHDLTSSRSLPNLQHWASEVGVLGTFQASYTEDRWPLNLGGLPVPCLVVGNKQDLVPKHRGRYPHTWNQQVWAAVQKPVSRLKGWLAAMLAGGGVGEAMSHSPSKGLPKDSLLHGNLQASVARGDIDMHAVTSFFCELIERRYCPSPPDCTALGAARLSSDRLPPVMYNAISEESSPYASLQGSRVHTPFASHGSLHQLSTCADVLARWQHHQQSPLAVAGGGGEGAPGYPPMHFVGCSAAVRLQGSGRQEQAAADGGKDGFKAGHGGGDGARRASAGLPHFGVSQGRG